MSVEIKICGLSTPATLEAAVSARADMIGLVFFSRSPRNVTLETARSLAALARGRTRIVALTVDATDALLSDIVTSVAPDLLQLHGAETPDRCAGIRTRFSIPVMKAIGVSTTDDLGRLPAYASVVDHILLDAKPPPDAVLPGGNGAAFDWSIINGLGRRQPFMLSGGLTPSNVAEAIRITAATAVDVSSGVEVAPGAKSPDLIRAFVAAARSA